MGIGFPGWRLALVAMLVMTSAPAPASVRFLHQPSVRGETVAFAYHGEIWTVARSGGKARRWTAPDGLSKSSPLLSPDGARIAYTARSGTNSDIFIIGAPGGPAERLTFSPGVDTALEWSEDGTRLLVTSDRANPFAQPELYELSVRGGTLVPYHLGKIHRASLGPDGLLAHTTLADPEPLWKRYRGGRSPSVLITRTSDGASVGQVPHGMENDTNPLWIGSQLYLLSDRDGTFGLYRFDRLRGAIDPLIVNAGYDIDWLAGDSEGIVFSSRGFLYASDLSGRAVRRIEVDLPAPIPAESATDVSGAVQSMALAGDGRTLALEAHGDIFVKPDQAPAFNLTRSPGAAERMPAWSPASQQLAYVSDGSGKYEIVVQEARRDSVPRRLGLRTGGYPFNLTWSPDGRKIAYVAADLSIWIVDVTTGEHVQTRSRAFPETPLEWAADSSGVIYIQRLRSGYGQLSFANIAAATIVPLTDELGLVRDFRLSADGKQLYFLASTSAGTMASDYDVSSLLYHQSIYGQIYALPGPQRTTTTGQRSQRVPQSDARYAFGQFTQPSLGRSILTGEGGALAVYQRTGFDPGYGMQGSGPTATLTGNSINPSFQLVVLDANGQAEPRLSGFAGSATGPGGASLDEFLADAVGRPSSRRGVSLVTVEGKPFVLSLGEDGRIGLKQLSVGTLIAKVKPDEEHKQIFEETARLFKAYLHDPAMNGTDWEAVSRRYRSWLPDVRSSADLYEVLTNMAGELSTSHIWISEPDAGQGAVLDVAGTLGADFVATADGPVLERILLGSPWDKEQSPLVGTGARPGDRLAAIDGIAVSAVEGIEKRLIGKAGKPVTLTFVGHGVTTSLKVVPLASDRWLRLRTWIEDRRQYVEQRSKGRLAYLHQPDTLDRGLNEFVRYFFAQANRQGLIVDDRYNTGGADPDFQLDVMGRSPFLLYRPRDMAPFGAPNSIIDGPKILLVNAESQSGGDVFPIQFKARKLGRVIGTRTWGGVDGYYRSVFYRESFPASLMDGGLLAVPDLATLSVAGERIVENVGFQPDEVVDVTPADFRAGRDPQLDRAIDLLLEDLPQAGAGNSDRIGN